MQPSRRSIAAAALCAVSLILYLSQIFGSATHGDLRRPASASAEGTLSRVKTDVLPPAAHAVAAPVALDVALAATRCDSLSCTSKLSAIEPSWVQLSDQVQAYAHS